MTNKKQLSSKNKLSSVSGEEVAKTLDACIKRSVKEGKSGGLLCVSLNNFFMVLSGYGVEYVDVVILELADEIKKVLGKDDLLMRVDVSHFNIIVMDASIEELDEIAAKVLDVIHMFGGKTSLEPVFFSATVGAVDFPGTSDKAKFCVEGAYVALCGAHNEYKHYLRYEEREVGRVQARNKLTLASYIYNAFINDKLRLAFQPIVDSKSGDINYYESLLRIVNNDGTTSSAGPFIPVAEDMGFIDMIDVKVFGMVLDELEKHPDLRLSVNVSNASVNDSVWLRLAVDRLKDPDMASRLVVEITETTEQYDIKKAIMFIKTLQDLGCCIALDDFGTGYTSFTQLKSLPVDIIKIDGSFVRDIAHNSKNRLFVKTLLEFGESFGLRTVAEFVENKEIADILIGMDVDFLQGNYISPAVNYKDWTDSVR